MEVKRVHLLFEQSGTFKKAFKNLGINAEDYDIQNEFGQTDHVIDLFGEVEKAFEGRKSIFDSFSKDDLIIAFFPCIRFEDQIIMSFRGDANQQKNHTLEQKMLNDIKLMNELSLFYNIVNKMFITCIRGGVKADYGKPLF